MNTTSPTWGDLVHWAGRRLGDDGDARRIVEQASGRNRAELALDADSPATGKGQLSVRAMVERRAAGEPLQYVLGAWGFRALDLFVDRRVLIPRPETETVVEVALAALGRLGRDAPVAVDLGTGSGAIALSLAAEAPTVTVWATDASPDALNVARANLAGLPGRAARRVTMAEGSWYDALPVELAGRVDLIVSNPPYVATGDELPAEVADWEPAAALFAGPDGLDALRAVVAQAPGWLNRPGALVVELAPHQADAVAALAGDAGAAEVRVHPDLAGRPRALEAVWA